jgi:hypothetical protein
MAARPLHPLKLWLLFINIVGGLGVLGSYAWGLGTHPGVGASIGLLIAISNLRVRRPA